MKRRKIRFKKIIAYVEHTFYVGEGFPRAPLLHNRPLMIHPVSCKFKMDMEHLMMYGNPSSPPRALSSLFR